MLNPAMQEVVARCELACQSEAVAHGFPGQAGIDIYRGCVADDLDGWNEHQFLLWVAVLETKYGNKNRALNNLYSAICRIMGQYAPMLKDAALESN